MCWKDSMNTVLLLCDAIAGTHVYIQYSIFDVRYVLKENKLFFIFTLSPIRMVLSWKLFDVSVRFAILYLNPIVAHQFFPTVVCLCVYLT